MTMSYWDQFMEFSENAENTILPILEPTKSYLKSPLAAYPLASFSSFFMICVAYLAMVLFGSLFMKYSGVGAFNVRPLKFVYNPLQVMFCAYMSIEAGVLAYRHFEDWQCPPYDAAKPVMGNVLYWFYLSKIADFCDTFFIIASKKWRQLSFLHVYHHLSIFAIFWVDLRVAYDGGVYVAILLNSGVHVLMYMYYFVSYHTNNIWWKKYLTVMQIAQFCILNAHALMALYTNCEKYPRRVIYLYFGYVQSILWLFVNFFIASYCLKTRKTKSA